MNSSCLGPTEAGPLPIERVLVVVDERPLLTPDIAATAEIFP